MSDIPASIVAKAKSNRESFNDLWLTISATVRDHLYDRALTEGAIGPSLAWATEFVAIAYAWIPEGEERSVTAFSGLTYGCGVQLWSMDFVDGDGNTVDTQVARKAVEEGDLSLMENTYMRWPLLPRKTWHWPLLGAPQVFPDPICRFGAFRTHDVHGGVDLFCELGTEVVAVEDGMVVGLDVFTGPNVTVKRAGPWWNETWAVLIEGRTGVVAYGECTPFVKMGDRVKAGQVIAVVDTPVLKKFKGRPMVMLHFELYTRGTTHTSTWGVDPTPLAERVQPPHLCDPTPYLEEAADTPEVFKIEEYDGKRFRDPTAETKASRWWAMWGGEGPPREE